MEIPKELSLENKTYGIAPYIVSESLQKAVEYAYHLKRPLLLRGEPGCGKTQFARVLAYQIYKENYNKKGEEKYFEWFVKSTSKATDGLYRFDYLKRLQDAQLNRLKEDKEYSKLGELGKAFDSSKKGSPSIILIDEIDKADIDFPNDLLLELDQKRFTIPEEDNRVIEAEEAPIVIITSNDERELPNAFLRRCVFCYINFPTGDLLVNILKAHMKNYVVDNPLSDENIKKIVAEFESVYKTMKDNSNKDKTISTSELIDWAKVIQKYGLPDSGGSIPLTSKGDGGKDYINYPEVLFKTHNDFKLFNAK